MKHKGTWENSFGAFWMFDKVLVLYGDYIWLTVAFHVIYIYAFIDLILDVLAQLNALHNLQKAATLGLYNNITFNINDLKLQCWIFNLIFFVYLIVHRDILCLTPMLLETIYNNILQRVQFRSSPSQYRHIDLHTHRFNFRLNNISEPTI